jgi:hypothetical protein
LKICAGGRLRIEGVKHKKRNTAFAIIKSEKSLFWVAFWLVGLIAWLLYVNSFELHELLLGATVSIFTASACEISLVSGRASCT